MTPALTVTAALGVGASLGVAVTLCWRSFSPISRTPAFCRRATSMLLPIVAFILLSLQSTAAPPTREVFDQATAELRRGAFGEALARYEQLSDSGVVDANLSFNRALAYLARAESPARRAGDLGQAAAALRETITLSGGDAEAERLLERVRRQIGRERARRGLDPLFAEPPLGRAITQLLPENAWAWTALVAALGLTAALVLRRWPAHSPQRLAGNVASVLCLLLLLSNAALTGWAAHLRKTETEAVVIVEQANLLDEAGAPLRSSRASAGSPLLPEGASVFVTTRRGRLSQVRWASVEAWVLSQQLRPLAMP